MIKNIIFDLDGVIRGIKNTPVLDILPNKSRIPEFLKALIARNKPTNVGKIFITVLIPSLQPTKKLSKTFIFAKKPYATM